MIRPASPADIPVILELVKDLADYERAPDAVMATEQLLHDALFGAEPRVFVHLAEHETREIAGFALWFVNFSTWLGRHGIYLEDLFVRPKYRGYGYGRRLLATLAKLCVERGYGRLEWWVLDWNEPALGFYRSIGAQPMDEWTVHRLTGEPLVALAAHAEEAPRDAGRAADRP